MAKRSLAGRQAKFMPAFIHSSFCGPIIRQRIRLLQHQRDLLIFKVAVTSSRSSSYLSAVQSSATSFRRS